MKDLLCRIGVNELFCRRMLELFGIIYRKGDSFHKKKLCSTEFVGKKSVTFSNFKNRQEVTFTVISTDYGIELRSSLQITGCIG